MSDAQRRRYAHLEQATSELSEAEPFETRPDGSPRANVMLDFRGNGDTPLWWRQDDDTWTDGNTVGTWTSITEGGHRFVPYSPFRNPQVLVHTAFVEQHGMAKAVIADYVERWLDARGLRPAREKALALLASIEPDIRPNNDTLSVLAGALAAKRSQLLAGLTAPSKELPTRHLWEVNHPYHGAEGTRGDLVNFESFAQLRARLNKHADDGSTVIYRWDWIDSHDPSLDGPDTLELGPDEFRVYGLLPRTGHLFEWYCPVSKDQEPDVLGWLRGPRMLGALQGLWAPLLDDPSETQQ